MVPGKGIPLRLQVCLRVVCHGLELGVPEHARMTGVPTPSATAMHLLQAGVNITVIALWLGHESPTTTHGYVEADLKMKEGALTRLQAPTTVPARYRPKDDLLRFLQELRHALDRSVPGSASRASRPLLPMTMPNCALQSGISRFAVTHSDIHREVTSLNGYHSRTTWNFHAGVQII